MEGEKDTQRPKGDDNHRWTNRRSWTRRLAGPVQYERFSALNAGNEPRIFFSFNLPEGQSRLDDSVYAVMNGHKKDDTGFPTGLKYGHDRIHGKTWSIGDTEHGRALADHIDMALKSVAEQLEREEGKRGR